MTAYLIYALGVLQIVLFEEETRSIRDSKWEAIFALLWPLATLLALFILIKDCWGNSR